MAQQDATTTVRTTVRDAVLAGVSADCGSDVVDSIEDVSVASTEQAALNAEPLLDFAEYKAVSL